LAVDLDRFRPVTAPAHKAARACLGVDDDRPVLVFVGNDKWRKGLDRALRLLALVRDRVDPRAVLLCAGRAVERSDPRVGVLALGSCDPVPLYRAGAGLLALSREDSFGLHVAEALACGVPVLVSVEAGASELVSGNELLGAVGPGEREVAWWFAEFQRLLDGAGADAVMARRGVVQGLHTPRHFAGLRELLVAGRRVAARPAPGALVKGLTA
jgi:glycosyltransferase involved in cell wall biosynthesis